MSYNEKLTLEPELIKHYQSDEVINELDSYSRFIEENLLYSESTSTQKIYYDSFYKDYVIYFCFLKYNRKAVFEFKLEYRDGISQVKDLTDLSYCNADIKVYRLQEGYSKIKQANYLRELKQLQEKYGIKDKK